jgi:alpha-glucosidase
VPRAVNWWREGVVYQAYPRSFADSNGDGIGDLPGLIGRLDHLQWLGVNGLWLNPIMPSPDKDFGYDVSDYCDVHPALGSLADLEHLVAEAGLRGIKVLLDLVPNHTSDQHPWFSDPSRRSWYVWADGRGADPPNNWRSHFGGTGWTFVPEREQWYLHQFLPGQPDLNWWNPKVRQEFDRILRFWFDRGVAGFRVDTAGLIVKDKELRDDPPSDETDNWWVRRHGVRPFYSSNRPEVHDVLRRWRRVCREYDPEAVLVGETFFLEMEKLRRYFAPGELHMAFNFLFAFAPFEAGALRRFVEASEGSLPKSGWPVWTASNHDMSRFPTRWCAGDQRQVRLAMVMLLTLRGTPVLYYGDELGMTDTDVPPDRKQDAIEPGRDPARTPMPWTGAPGAGFTGPGVEPWLPFGDIKRNVESQARDAGSVLHLVRDLIALRRSRADLRGGAYASLPSPESTWLYRRGRKTLVALNFSDRPRPLGLAGKVVLSTDRSREGSRIGALQPFEGAVLEAES